jgi:hypothetical protein
MNDLAEKALHGLDVARREVIARPMLAFAVLGLAISTSLVVAGSRVNAARPTHPLSTWLGLQDSHGARPDDWAPAAAMLGAVVALVALWLAIVGFVRRRDQPESRVWWTAAVWALPFVLGPPLLGTTVQSYAAFGLLQRRGLSPYDFGPNHLGSHPIVAAIDPGSRGTPSSAGPLGTLVQHLAMSVSAGGALGAVLVMRAVGIVAAVVIGRLAADLAGMFRSRALTLTVLNPLLLLYVVSAARLDGLMIALVLAAISAANQRRWVRWVILACIAGSVAAQAFLLVPAIIAVHWLGRRSVPTWLLLGRDILVAAVTTAAAGFVVPDGFGWVRTVSKQFSAHTPFSVTSAIAKLLSPIVRGASYDDLAAGARIAAVTAAVGVIVYLLITVRQRALERTAGYSLLALALLAPVLYPWYLLWGTVCLAPTANGTRRAAVLALCAAGCLLNPPGFTSTTTHVLTAICLAAIALVVTFLPTLRRTTPSSPPVSARV